MALFVFYWAVALSFRYSTKDQSVEYGTSFSQKYAEELGLDWKQTYLAILDDLKIEKLRLMSYWDIHEPELGEYNFENLDWQLDEAAKREVDVVLVLGARQPRYPECHLPGWADNLESEELDTFLIDYVKHVSGRYVDHPAIEAWQLENEPKNVVFSTCKPYFNRERLEDEFAAVREIDPNREIYMTLSTEYQLPLIGAVGDRVGYSVYEEVSVPVFGKNVQWQHIVPSSWHSFRSGLVSFHKDKPTYIHELQAEPWGTQATINLSEEEQARSMTPEKFLDNLDYAQETGNKLIYLWGSEWWYWQKTVNNDSAMWNTVSQILSE